MKILLGVLMVLCLGLGALLCLFTAIQTHCREQDPDERARRLVGEDQDEKGGDGQ